MKLITKCRDLMLTGFIDCLVYQNYDVLVVEGNATEQDKAAAWDQVWNEYLTLINLPNYKYVTELIRQIALLYLKLNIVEWNVKALQNGYYPDCVKALKDVGLNYKFDPEDPLQYAADLDAAVKKSKSWVVEYQQRQKEYDQYQKSAPKEAITEEAFMDNLATLGKVMGFRIDPHSVSVAEYCSMMKIAVKNG